jgi:hypothetical protein
MSMKNHCGMISTGENSWVVHHSALWHSYQQESYSSKLGGAWRRDDNFSLRSIFVHNSKWFLTCHKILRHGTDGFTSPPKKACCRFLSPLNIHRPRPGLNPRTLGPMASTPTISPPRPLKRSLADTECNMPALGPRLAPVIVVAVKPKINLNSKLAYCSCFMVCSYYQQIFQDPTLVLFTTQKFVGLLPSC